MENGPRTAPLHLVGIETKIYQPRIRQMTVEDGPVFQPFDEAGHMGDGYRPEGDVVALAGLFVAERAKTLAMLESLGPGDWARRGVWPEAEVDLAWVAERCLSHGLEHFAGLLILHQRLERFHAPGVESRTAPLTRKGVQFGDKADSGFPRPRPTFASK